jgi:hypothetical protein
MRVRIIAPSETGQRKDADAARPARQKDAAPPGRAPRKFDTARHRDRTPGAVRCR